MLRDLARELRKKPTKWEKDLWFHLQKRNLAGLRFRRQRVIGKFVVDFVCLERKLIVELDGNPHRNNRILDEMRTQSLMRFGFKVLRFWNSEIENSLISVLENIKKGGNTPTPPSPKVGEEQGK